MPTNILRQSSQKAAGAALPRARAEAPRRFVAIRSRAVEIRVQLLDTPTADRIWQALPIRSTAQFWGEEIFFETTVESGRERAARTIVQVGEVAFAPDRDVIAIAWGRTPASRKGEARLWSPSNVWGRAVDDVRLLARVRPGERIDVTAVAAPEDQAEAN